MYPVLGCKRTSRIHKSIASHHKKRFATYQDKVEMFIDWECARFTKPDKPLNGEETHRKYYRFMYMDHIINNFNLCEDLKKIS